MSKEQSAIRDFIQLHNIRQADIATAYGCSRSAVSQFLSGNRPIPGIARFIAALSKILGGVVRFEIELLTRDGEVKDYFVHITHRVPEIDPEENQ